MVPVQRFGVCVWTKGEKMIMIFMISVSKLIETVWHALHALHAM